MRLVDDSIVDGQRFYLRGAVLVEYLFALIAQKRTSFQFN